MAQSFINSVGPYLCRGLLLLIPFSKYILPGWVSAKCVSQFFSVDSFWYEQVLLAALVLGMSMLWPRLCRDTYEREPRVFNFVACSTVSWYVGLFATLIVVWWSGDIARMFP